MAVTEAVENYLEAILVLKRKQPDVHAIYICNYFNYSRPTVSVALKQMKDKGFILVNGENHISLTDEGLEVAERIYERHTILSKMLVSLGVSEATALEDACKIEHDLSDETFQCIKKHFNEIMAKEQK